MSNYIFKQFSTTLISTLYTPSSSCTSLTFIIFVAKNVVIKQQISPIAVIEAGKNIAQGVSCQNYSIVEATTKVALLDSAKEPKRSAPIPATSPTLSPTLSAIVPGFFGLSSSKPYSTLPTKSAPTSAAFV